MANEPYNPSPVGNPSVLARRNWWQTQLVILIGKHTPKCNEMVRILSKSMDEPMSLSMRIKKRFHYLICCWCQRYEEQLHYMREVSRAFPEHADEADTTPVAAQTKERWKQALRAAPEMSAAGRSSLGEIRERQPMGPSGIETSGRNSLPWLLLIGAAAVLLLLFDLTWQRPAARSRALSDFRDEMVSFARVEPALDIRSNQLSQLKEWISKSGAPSSFVVPPRMQRFEPVGCRVLRFRGHDVTLICFRRDNGTLLHLFVMDRAGMPSLPGRDRADFSTEGDWMTGTWMEDGHVYMVAIQGDEKTLSELLGEA